MGDALALIRQCYPTSGSAAAFQATEPFAYLEQSLILLYTVFLQHFRPVLKIETVAACLPNVASNVF
jgi:hypothetical protein